MATSLDEINVAVQLVVSSQTEITKIIIIIIIKGEN